MKRPRVLMADDHAAALEEYRKLLDPRCEVVAIVADGQSAVESAERSKPDVIVMDISMPGMNGLEACRQLRKTLPGAKVVLMSLHAGAEFITGAFGAGASGYVLKQYAASELLFAIERVLGDQIYVTPCLHNQLWDDTVASPERLAALPDSQRQVVTLVGQGLTTKEIAAAMGISFQTAVRRRRAAMRRLQITQPIDLVRFAIRCRLTAD